MVSMFCRDGPNPGSTQVVAKQYELQVWGPRYYYSFKFSKYVNILANVWYKILTWQDCWLKEGKTTSAQSYSILPLTNAVASESSFIFGKNRPTNDCEDTLLSLACKKPVWSNMNFKYHSARHWYKLFKKTRARKTTSYSHPALVLGKLEVRHNLSCPSSHKEHLEGIEYVYFTTNSHVAFPQTPSQFPTICGVQE